MRKIVLFLHTGYCGMDAWEFWQVPETATEDELDELSWDRAKDNAESFGIYPAWEYADSEDFDENDEAYSDNIEGSWEDYNPDKHDGHTMNGTPDWQEY